MKQSYKRKQETSKSEDKINDKLKNYRLEKIIGITSYFVMVIILILVYFLVKTLMRVRIIIEDVNYTLQFIYLFSFIYIIVYCIVYLVKQLKNLKIMIHKIKSLNKKQKLKVILEVSILIILYIYFFTYILIPNYNFVCGRKGLLNVLYRDYSVQQIINEAKGDPRTYFPIIPYLADKFTPINAYFNVRFNQFLSVLFVLILYLLSRHLFSPIESFLIVFASLSMTPITTRINSIEVVFTALFFWITVVFLFIRFLKKYILNANNINLKIEDFLFFISVYILATLTRYELALIFGLPFLFSLLLIFHIIPSQYSNKKQSIYSHILMLSTYIILIILTTLSSLTLIRLYSIGQDVNLKGYTSGFIEGFIARLKIHLFEEHQLSFPNGVVTFFYLLSIIISSIITIYGIIYFIKGLINLITFKSNKNDKSKDKLSKLEKEIIINKSSLIIFSTYFLLYFILKIGFHVIGLYNIENYNIHNYHSAYFIVIGTLKLVFDNIKLKLINKKKNRRTIKKANLSLNVVYFILVVLLFYLELKTSPIIYHKTLCEEEFYLIRNATFSDSINLQCTVIRYNDRYPYYWYVIKDKIKNYIFLPKITSNVNGFIESLNNLTGCFLIMIREYSNFSVIWDWTPSVSLNQFKEIINKTKCEISKIYNVSTYNYEPERKYKKYVIRLNC